MLKVFFYSEEVLNFIQKIAYELRMLDDEDADYMDDGDAHMPDFSLPPLEKNRVFASLGLEKGVVSYLLILNPYMKGIC